MPTIDLMDTSAELASLRQENEALRASVNRLREMIAIQEDEGASFMDVANAAAAAAQVAPAPSHNVRAFAPGEANRAIEVVTEAFRTAVKGNDLYGGMLTIRINAGRHQVTLPKPQLSFTLYPTANARPTSSNGGAFEETLFETLLTAVDVRMKEERSASEGGAP